jgi:hypothetical protein
MKFYGQDRLSAQLFCAFRCHIVELCTGQTVLSTALVAKSGVEFICKKKHRFESELVLVIVNFSAGTFIFIMLVLIRLLLCLH